MPAKNFLLLWMSCFLGLFTYIADASPFSVFDPKTRFFCGKSPTGSELECNLYPIRTENECKVALLINGESSLKARFSLLNLPISSLGERVIQVQSLIFTGDESGWYIAHKLVQMKRADSELRIQIIIDGVFNVSPKNQAMYFYMYSHGIEFIGNIFDLAQDIKRNSIPTALNNRFHEKMWTVDNGKGEKFSIIGGMNIANEYFRVENNPKRKWRDQDAIVRGKIVDDIKDSFTKNMSDFSKFSTPHKTDYSFSIQGENYKASEIARDPFLRFLNKEILKNIKNLDIQSMNAVPLLEPSICRWFQSRPRFGETFIMQVYQKLIEESNDEILIANAYVILNDPSFIELLKNAARRGANIHLLTNSDRTNDITRITILGRSYYQDLLDVNLEPNIKGSIKIYEWYGQEIGMPQTDGTLHAKYAVFVKKADSAHTLKEKALIIGSFNLDPRSRDLNSESILVLKNDRLANQLQQQFYQDLKKSRLIGAADAKKWQSPERFTEKAKLETLRLLEHLH